MLLCVSEKNSCNSVKELSDRKGRRYSKAMADHLHFSLYYYAIDLLRETMKHFPRKLPIKILAQMLYHIVFFEQEAANHVEVKDSLTQQVR